MPEPRSDEATATTAVSVIIRIEPFLHRSGAPFVGDVQALAEQVCHWIADNVSARLTAEHSDSGLCVIAAVTRGGEHAAYRYDEGHYVKDEPQETTE